MNGALKHTITTIASALALAFTAAACSGGGSAVNALPQQQAPQVPAGTPYTGPAALADFDWGKAALAQMVYAGPATFASLSINVQVQMSNAPGLMRYAQEVSDPQSALYRHFLTPQEIGDAFGASPSDYAKVENYFAKYGMSVGGWPQRESVTVTGTQRQLQAAFGTAFGTYAFRKTPVYAPTQTPHFSQVLPIAQVSGLVAYTAMRRDIIQGSGYANYRGYTPQQMANGFDYSGAYGAGYNGAGITVGIIGTGPIANGSNGDTQTYASTFGWKMAALTQVSAQPQAPSAANGNTGTGSVDPNPGGLAPAPPATTPSCNPGKIPNYVTCNPEDGEAQLDTEQVAGLAPGAGVDFYLAYNPSECLNPSTGGIDPPKSTNPLVCPAGDEVSPLEGIQITDDEIQQAIADNAADALTLSFGEPENDARFAGYITGNPASPGPGEIEFASLAAEGIAVFVSSGDGGADECFDPQTGAPLGTPCVDYPASDPNVVAVGGVNAPFDSYGRLTGQILAWADETTQGGVVNCPDGQVICNDVGSGGGISAVETAPTWQTANVPNLGTAMRAVPDISYMADPNTGPTILLNAPWGAQIGASGGTSAAAPEAAAAWALVLQACKSTPSCATGSGSRPYRLGNPAPLLYAIYGGSYGAPIPKGSPSAFTPHLSYASTFYDVVYGFNGANGLPSPGPSPSPGASPGPSPTPIAIPGYTAGVGYDEVTGLGVPFVGHLIQAITGQVVP